MEKERTKGIGKERMAYRLKAGQIWKMERRRGPGREGMVYVLEVGKIWKRNEGEEWGGREWYTGLKWCKYGKGKKERNG